MKFKIKKILIRFLLRLLNFLSLVKEGLKYFFLWGLIKPLFFIFKTLFLPIIILFYKLFFTIQTRIKIAFLPSKNKVFYLFTKRYLIHVFIIIIALLVTTNSIWARDIKVGEFGKKTILSQLITNPQEDEITEYATEKTLIPHTYLDNEGFLQSQLVLEQESLETELAATELAVTGQGTILMKANVPTTSIDAISRDKIIEYEVQGGDTVSTIAAQFGISTKTVLYANNLTESSYIKPGNKLIIPPVTGVVHKVKKGDTLEKIAKKYESDVNKILEFNKIATPEAIEEGQIIIVPGGKIPEPPKPVYPTPTSRYAYSSPVPSSAKAAPGPKLLWPTTSHRINQYFSWRHRAIDIDGTYSSPVYASQAGTVESIGWGRGYGNRIIINHGDKKTLYAHLSKIFVSPGNYVKKGQTIGMQGCTGWCTGVHLHFEVIIGGRKVNPLSYL